MPWPAMGSSSGKGYARGIYFTLPCLSRETVTHLPCHTGFESLTGKVSSDEGEL